MLYFVFVFVVVFVVGQVMFSHHSDQMSQINFAGFWFGLEGQKALNPALH